MALDLKNMLNEFQSLGISFLVGTGAPTQSVAKGSIYMRTDGSSSSTRMYIATDAVGTWTAVTTAA